jgi:hypothetical protein
VKVCFGPRLCQNARDEASGSAVSAAAAVTSRVEFLGEGPAPYAFMADISGPVPLLNDIQDVFVLPASDAPVLALRAPWLHRALRAV